MDMLREDKRLVNKQQPNNHDPIYPITREFYRHCNGGMQRLIVHVVVDDVTYLKKKSKKKRYKEKHAQGKTDERVLPLEAA